jgi:hypothetical protein
MCRPLILLIDRGLIELVEVLEQALDTRLG